MYCSKQKPVAENPRNLDQAGRLVEKSDLLCSTPENVNRCGRCVNGNHLARFQLGDFDCPKIVIRLNVVYIRTTKYTVMYPKSSWNRYVHRVLLCGKRCNPGRCLWLLYRQVTCLLGSCRGSVGKVLGREPVLGFWIVALRLYITVTVARNFSGFSATAWLLTPSPP